MQPLRLFVDTHDVATGTLPAGLTRTEFAGFYPGYAEACAAEGVVLLGTQVGYADGRAFCLTLAPDADAVRRAHARAGLPFDTVTEVESAGPHDTLARLSACPA